MSQIPLRVDEQIVSEVRQRALTFMWQWIVSLTLLLGAAVGMFWLFRHGNFGIIGFVLLIFGGVWGLATTYMRTRGTVLLITTHRIVDIVKDGLFGKTISEAELGDIEDVVVRQRGISRTIFKYGTVEIRIRNSKIRIVVDRVSRPAGVQRLINELRKHSVGQSDGERQVLTLPLVLRAVSRLGESETIQVKKAIETRLKQLRP